MGGINQLGSGMQFGYGLMGDRSNSLQDSLNEMRFQLALKDIEGLEKRNLEDYFSKMPDLTKHEVRVPDMYLSQPQQERQQTQGAGMGGMPMGQLMNMFGGQGGMFGGEGGLSSMFGGGSGGAAGGGSSWMASAGPWAALAAAIIANESGAIDDPDRRDQDRSEYYQHLLGGKPLSQDAEYYLDDDPFSSDAKAAANLGSLDFSNAWDYFKEGTLGKLLGGLF